MHLIPPPSTGCTFHKHWPPRRSWSSCAKWRATWRPSAWGFTIRVVHDCYGEDLMGYINTITSIYIYKYKYNHSALYYSITVGLSENGGIPKMLIFDGENDGLPLDLGKEIWWIIYIYIYIFFLGCNMTEDVSVSDLNKLDATWLKRWVDHRKWSSCAFQNGFTCLKSSRKLWIKSNKHLACHDISKQLQQGGGDTPQHCVRSVMGMRIT